MAIGDEDGGVRLLESSKEKPDWSTPYVKFRPHHNAILDASFSSDDLLLVTASGDQTAKVVDMRTQTPIYAMARHLSSVKQARFQPGSSNIIATSSRDGSVFVWDLRCKSIEGPLRDLKVRFVSSFCPLYAISEIIVSSKLRFWAYSVLFVTFLDDFSGSKVFTNAYECAQDPNNAQPKAARTAFAECVNAVYEAHKVHETVRTRASMPTPNRIPNKPASDLDAPSRSERSRRHGDVSVTSLTFLPHGREHLLLTGSEADASVRLWDLRTRLSNRRGHSTPLSVAPCPESHDKYRHYGLTSMSLSNDGARLYTLCRDNRIYAYATSHLILGHAPEFSAASTSRRFAGKEKSGLGPLYGMYLLLFLFATLWCHITTFKTPTKPSKASGMAVSAPRHSTLRPQSDLSRTQIR